MRWELGGGSRGRRWLSGRVEEVGVVEREGAGKGRVFASPTTTSLMRSALRWMGQRGTRGAVDVGTGAELAHVEAVEGGRDWVDAEEGTDAAVEHRAWRQGTRTTAGRGTHSTEQEGRRPV